MVWYLVPRGDTLIFSYIRRLGSFGGCSKVEFHFFCGRVFLAGYEDFVDTFWGNHNLDLFRGHVYAFLGIS